MKTVLVTGTGSGFGFLTTLELLRNGYRVVATMRTLQSHEKLIEAAKQEQLASELDVFEMDVTDDVQIQHVKEFVQSKYKKLDMLVNNAGFCQAGFISDLSVDAFYKQIDVNLHGVFRVTKAMLPLLEQVNKANIINVSSISGYAGFPGMSAYSSSKFALEGLSESLRIELLPKNIFVSLVEPGSYQTDIWAKSLSSIDSSEMEKDPFKSSVLTYAQQSSQASADPREVAVLIVAICNKKNPKLRYPIGKGASMFSLAKRFLPWSWLEIIMLKRLK
ncbi:NADP-dependent 3-hydroxy acid dehydrogenase YdfG [Gracilibacillus orientalis]|uniref:NADP-dependent 3-hydroxy acid dehydrogenase YdfG n=1 Tax=Gracilibacillus orientalis TaxID=334253 RepID=A0A1I4IRZ9_9BACI|nr:SDR family oxidoreductase [Gracilibacillus orientalis]SFL57138.1 NADP-dependent 3-hydroxy acid dehydrogenase YdfG [Gracilibacillus orientalis]